MSKVASSFLCLALLAFAGSALAQRTLNVQDRDEPGRAPYQHAVTATPSPSTCSSRPNVVFGTLSYCVLTFPAVPSGKRLVITHASAVVEASALAAVYVAGPQGLDGMRVSLPPSSNGVGGGSVSSSPVTYFVEAGATPTLVVTVYGAFDSRIEFFGSLSGYLVTLP
jgi:hypothetical protein